MKILAIDSSSTPASIAVTDGEMPIGEFTININRTHSEKLLPLVDSLLDAINLKASDIDVFAVSVGPGSFTGLRIGMSAAKLMAQTLGKPLIGVKTLEALAENVCAFDGFIAPVIDARNNTFYTALYECSDGELREIYGAEALETEALCERLCNMTGRVLVCGEYIKYRSKISELTSLSGNVRFAPVHISYQRAVSCAVLAYKQYMRGDVTMPEAVTPLYVRESQAEQARKAKKP